MVSLEAGGAQLRSTLSDRNGFYQIGSLAAETYTLRAQYVGYEVHEEEVTLGADEQLRLSVPMASNPFLLEGVSVNLPGGAAVRDLGRQRITPIDLSRVPMPAASGDLTSYLQTLPGVMTTGDRGGQIFVRGGTHTENMTLMDGLMVYQPFHIIGFFSVFPEDLIANVDFYAGGFGPRYAGRNSSVVDVQMRDGNRNEYAATASVSPFLAEVQVEGPLAPGRLSWIASARRSVLEETSPSFLGERQPLSFESQFIKVTSFGEYDSRCSALGLRTADSGRLDVEADDSHVSWSNVAIGGRCTALFDGILRFLDLNLGYSSVRNATVTRGSSELFSNTTRLNAELNTTQVVNGLRAEAGYQIRMDRTAYDMMELFGRRQLNESLLGLRGYAEVTIPIGERIELRPGMSLTLSPGAWLEPRLRGSWRVSDRVDGELSGALGLYRQDLAGVSDVRDASSVFVAWIPVPGGSQTQALHAQAGWQQRHTGGLQWSAEGYYRRLRDVAVPVWEGVAEFNTTLGLVDGRAYGADGRVEYGTPRFYAYTGYGYSWAQYESAQNPVAVWFGEAVEHYHPPHDRRHQLNTILSAELGSFTAGARWQFGTGLPFTRPMGFDEVFDYRFYMERVDLLRGSTRIVVERPYRARLPLTHRLDLSVERAFDLGFATLDVQAGVVNIYDRTNMFYYDIFTQRRVDQLPLVPYVSLKTRLP